MDYLQAALSLNAAKLEKARQVTAERRAGRCWLSKEPERREVESPKRVRECMERRAWFLAQVEAGKSNIEIGKLCGISVKSVCRALIRHGIRRPPQEPAVRAVPLKVREPRRISWNKPMLKRVREAMQDGTPRHLVAKSLGVSEASLAHVIKRHLPDLKGCGGVNGKARGFDYEEARRLRDSGMKLAAIAEQMGVKIDSVWYAVSRSRQC